MNKNDSISVVTATFKSDTFLRCRESIVSQTVPIEHVIVDGGSGEPWETQIKQAIDGTSVFVSEPDRGIYDAINKGIRLSRGDIVGLLHSDDVFHSSLSMEYVQDAFRTMNCDVVYGDLIYVDQRDNPVRYWKSRPFGSTLLANGWMPPHPTVFIRRELFDVLGMYDDSYTIAGDYEFILRLFKTPELRIHYLPRVITRMTLGGTSNRNIRQIVAKMKEDVKAMQTHQLNPFIALPGKNLSKLSQFLMSPGTQKEIDESYPTSGS